MSTAVYQCQQTSIYSDFENSIYFLNLINARDTAPPKIMVAIASTRPLTPTNATTKGRRSFPLETFNEITVSKQ